jgi:hypothetical protein
MLFCTSLIALVGAADQPQSSPRKLQIVNTKVCLLLINLPILLSILICPPPSSFLLVAPIDDLRTPLSIVHSGCQAEQEDAGDRAGDGDIHLRHIEYEAAARYRDDA